MHKVRKLFSQIVKNEETVYAESEDLRNYFGEFCTNQSSLHGETLFDDANCWARRRSQLVVKDSTITAFGRSIMVWPTPGSPSHQKHGTLSKDFSIPSFDRRRRNAGERRRATVGYV
jgi:hypothetical protein